MKVLRSFFIIIYFFLNVTRPDNDFYVHIIMNMICNNYNIHRFIIKKTHNVGSNERMCLYLCFIKPVRQKQANIGVQRKFGA